MGRYYQRYSREDRKNQCIAVLLNSLWGSGIRQMTTTQIARAMGLASVTSVLGFLRELDASGDVLGVSVPNARGCITRTIYWSLRPHRITKGDTLKPDPEVIKINGETQVAVWRYENVAESVYHNEGYDEELPF